VLDTDRYFVVCANVLGGCQGSTGPSSVDPATGVPWGARFPVVTMRDIVRAQARLADHLGVRRWLTVVGGSMGGMQVVEWAVMFPQRIRSFISMASCLQASAWQIAWSAAGRTALALDPNWRGGDYYDAPRHGPAPRLAVAIHPDHLSQRSGLP
jgi:homoserine O-acetyltransferase